MLRNILLVACALFILPIGIKPAVGGEPSPDQTLIKTHPPLHREYPSIVIYTLSTCPHCRDAKEYMKGNHIPFTNREVDTDDTAMAELMKVYDAMGVPEEKRGVPLFIIGGKIKLEGFNKERFETALKEAKQK